MRRGTIERGKKKTLDQRWSEGKPPETWQSGFAKMEECFFAAMYECASFACSDGEMCFSFSLLNNYTDYDTGTKSKSIVFVFLTVPSKLQ